MDYWQKRILEKLANEYAEWESVYRPRFVDEEELEAELEDGVDSSFVWCYSNFFDYTSWGSEREFVEYSGAGYVAEVILGEDGAIAVLPATKGTVKQIYSEVRLDCEFCQSAAFGRDNNCYFCNGDSDVWFFFHHGFPCRSADSELIEQNVSSKRLSESEELRLLLAGRLPLFERYCMAFNPKLSSPAIESLASDESERVRSQVAINSSITEQVSLLLTKDQPRVRFCLASNPNLSKSLFQILAEEEDERIRAKLATNPNLPLEQFDQLTNDPSKGVRFFLVSNTNITVKALEKLSKDSDSEVRQIALKRLVRH